jgi:hypothetical protein
MPKILPTQITLPLARFAQVSGKLDSIADADPRRRSHTPSAARDTASPFRDGSQA